MQRLRFINSINQEIIFDNIAPRVFWKIAGLETPTAEPVFTQAAGQHGYTVHSLLLPQRAVRVTGHIHGKHNADMYGLRKQTASVCSPVLGEGRLRYENDAGEWQIPAFVKNIVYGEKATAIQTIEILFECPSPFWLEASPNVIKLAYVEGGMNFPLGFPGYFGTLGYRAVIENDGNIPIPLLLSIGGGSLNPVVLNGTTGEKIQIQRRFHDRDKLYINTDPDNISIQIVTIDDETNQPKSENAFGYLTDDSELFMLQPGENKIYFMSSDENKKVSVNIEFYRRYAGV